MTPAPTAARRRHVVEWTNPAVAYAAAVRAADTANRVEWTDADGTPAYTVLLPYDALGLAKDLVRNGVADVELITATRTLDPAAILAARF